jgi:hypothetical protein
MKTKKAEAERVMLLNDYVIHIYYYVKTSCEESFLKCARMMITLEIFACAGQYGWGRVSSIDG